MKYVCDVCGWEYDEGTRRRMRMAVHIAGFAVGGPAGMADAAAALALA